MKRTRAQVELPPCVGFRVRVADVSANPKMGQCGGFNYRKNGKETLYHAPSSCTTSARRIDRVGESASPAAASRGPGASEHHRLQT
jgi:hypothetical protein